MGTVVVLGSMNYDCIALVDAFPQPGTTLAARDLMFRLGGKGANQAVAAAAQDARVLMLGCAGLAYMDYLQRRSIDTAGVIVREDVPTGTALICVRPDAENTIVVGLGANATFTRAELEERKHLVAMGTVMLAQFESPLDVVAAALRMAKPMGTATCLNPSPWREGFAWGTCELDFVIVNEHEARKLLGRVVTNLGDIGWIRPALSEKAIHTLIVTRGHRSTLAFADKGPSYEIPILHVEAVDTVGAGDCFTGTFAARWAECRQLEPALRAASVAGALATLKPGAQEATPTTAEVDAALLRLDA
jgi:ribokinase